MPLLTQSGSRGRPTDCASSVRGDSPAQVNIGIASPETIRGWSHGEAENDLDVDRTTLRPLPGGLFCEVIFGPSSDWACSCGMHDGVNSNGIVCERCGVEVSRAKVRRERMGHIELAAPVTHAWFALADGQDLPHRTRTSP